MIRLTKDHYLQTMTAFAIRSKLNSLLGKDLSIRYAHHIASEIALVARSATKVSEILQ